MMLDVTYTLRAGARSLEVQVRFDNTCTHHRLRAMFPTGVETDVSFAESPFDVVHRRIPRDAENPYAYMPHLTYPLLRFCGVESVDRAFTCLSGGLKEYEVLDTPERTLALTLMRAYENNLCTAGDFDLEHQPGSLSQSPGAHDLSYRIYPGAVGRGLSRVFREADRMTAPLAVAETKARAGIGLPSAGGFLSIEDERVQLSGLTGEARGERIVLRVFNPTDSDVETQVTCGFPIVRATLTNLNEEDDSPCPVNARGIRLTVPARKIVTVALDPGCGGQQA
jgi:alpha-mannosidase